MRLLDKKCVLVTGGSRGIGEAIVKNLLQEGAEVAFTYLQSVQEAERLAGELSAEFPRQRCLARQCDATDTAAMDALVNGLVAEFGRLDGLVNNAGIARDSVLARMSRGQWDNVMETNLGSLYNATKPLILHMVKQRAGAIVNISSAVGIYGNSGQTNYAAAKAGMIGFTKALSAEVAQHNVRVNVVAPGYINTDMMAMIDQETHDYVKSRISMRRIGNVEDVSAVVCFLLSDKAGYITGQVIQVDGGITL